VVGAITWQVVGRSLAPVEEIRVAADAVSATDPGRRVPVPASDDEIARLAETMNRMLDRLEQSHDRQRRFVSDASHELRSPLATIREHAEVARGHPETTSTEALAGTVLVRDAAGRYDYVVIDTPPLPQADDVLRLATEVDAVIVVARRDHIRQSALEETSDLLATVGATPYGSVLLNTPRRGG
jgi:signal transduction histidine kinase